MATIPESANEAFLTAKQASHHSLTTSTCDKASKGRPSFEQSQQKDVLNALLGAASSCLKDNERTHITVREIANIAGVNQAMVNYYFKSKDGLFLSLYERDYIDLTRKLGQFAKQIESDVDGLLSISALMKTIEEHLDERHGFAAFDQNEHLAEHSAIHEAYIQRLSGRCYATVVRIMAAFMAKGSCRTDVSAEHAAFVVCSLCVFPFLIGSVFPSAFPSKGSGGERESRRQTVTVLLSPPT